jgi:hypothetical protein
VRARRLTRHAEERLRQRGITTEDVISALNREIRTSPGQPGTTWVWGYAAAGRILKVCVRRDAEEDVVITAVWPDA